MPDFAAVVETSALNGTNGFQLSGTGTSSLVGWSVSNAGDVNGDGRDDFILGGRGSVGGAYLVFGTGGGFPADLSLTSLNGANGFKLAATGGALGADVSAAGDINGDGFDDLIIGSPYDSPDGAAWVVFGKATPFAASFNTASLTASDGFKITVADDGAYGAKGGMSVASAGDINGDGFDDIIIGAPGFFGSEFRTGSGDGAAFVVFGHAGNFGAGLSVGSLNGSNGFRVVGIPQNYSVGISVDAAGDLNNDGVDDIIIGGQTGGAYVIYGHTGAFTPSFTLLALGGTTGTTLLPEVVGNFSGAVSGAGDVNGDGIDDLIVGSSNADGKGAAYVVFGKTGGLGNSLNLSSLNGANGFKIVGETVGDGVGSSVRSAGDLNADGYDDLIIGAVGADPNGSSSGAAYVVFGHGGAFSPTLLLSGLTGPNGFQINGEAAGDGLGAVSGAGDLNGDGIADILVGAPQADPGFSNAGAAYVIYGMASAVIETGTAGDDTYSGADSNDTLSGAGGRDTLSGLGGDDTLDGGAMNDVLYGGDGADDILGGAGGDILYGDADSDDLDGGVGNDKLFGGDGADDLVGGDGNDRLVGEAGDDTLLGGLGNDQLDGGGGGGLNVMTGGLGNDIYYVRNATDVVTELAGEGFDIVKATRSYTLVDNIENLELLGGNWSGTGNALGNRLTGSAGANTLSGLAGNDLLFGGDGDDVLIGGVGRDQLTGGAGADRFVVADESVGLPVLEIDQILDFDRTQNDRLDLSAVDADTGTGGDQAFQVVAAFSHTAGEVFMFYVADQNVTTVRLDVDGDGRADYQLRLNGDLTGSTDWLLL